MFNCWFQKLGGSEPTPDGLALTFEFVRSKKGSLYEENVKIMIYVCKLFLHCKLRG